MGKFDLNDISDFFQGFFNNALGEADKQKENPYFQEAWAQFGPFADMLQNQFQGSQWDARPGNTIDQYNTYLANQERASSDQLLADFDKAWKRGSSDFDAQMNAWGLFGGDRLEQRQDLLQDYTRDYTNARESLWSDIGTRRQEFAQPYLMQANQNAQSQWNSLLWATLQGRGTQLGAAGNPFYTDQGSQGWLSPVMGTVGQLLPFL